MVKWVGVARGGHSAQVRMLESAFAFPNSCINTRPSWNYLYPFPQMSICPLPSRYVMPVDRLPIRADIMEPSGHRAQGFSQVRLYVSATFHDTFTEYTLELETQKLPFQIWG